MVWNMRIIAMITPTIATVILNDVEQPSHGHLRQLAFRDLRLGLELAKLPRRLAVIPPLSGPAHAAVSVGILSQGPFGGGGCV